MGKKTVSILPQTHEILLQMGGQIKLARLRRRLSLKLIAELAGISRATLWNVEKGGPSVAIGIYASVLHALNRMDKGDLWVAKFPSKNDEINTGAWEKVVHDLAKPSGLNVPESKLEVFSKLGSTFLVKRFDRDGDKLIHFASAMTMLWDFR